MFVDNGHDRNYKLAVISEKGITEMKLMMKITSRILSNYRGYQSFGPKIRKELKKLRCLVVFTSAANLKRIFCSKKLLILPNNYPGVH